MALLFKDYTKTYATRENAEKAIRKRKLEHFRYVIAVGEDGRYFPVFIGQDAAHRGVFHFFPTAA